MVKKAPYQQRKREVPVPTESELDRKIETVSVRVTGTYFERLDGRGMAKRNYEIDVLVPKNFTLSHVKRRTAKALMESEKYNSSGMRTFLLVGNPKPSKEKVAAREFLSDKELARIERMREVEKEKAKQRRRDLEDSGLPMDEEPRVGSVSVDDSEDDENGLPPFVDEK